MFSVVLIVNKYFLCQTTFKDNIDCQISGYKYTDALKCYQRRMIFKTNKKSDIKHVNDICIKTYF